MKAIKTYLALRCATRFAMLNAEYLLKSFAAFATAASKCMSTRKSQSIGLRASRLSRNAMPGCRPSVALCVMPGLKTPA